MLCCVAAPTTLNSNSLCCELWKWRLHYRVALPYPPCCSPQLNSATHSDTDPSSPLSIAIITHSESPPPPPPLLPPNPIEKRKVQGTRSSQKMRDLQEGMCSNPNQLLLNLLAFRGKIRTLSSTPRISRYTNMPTLFIF